MNKTCCFCHKSSGSAEIHAECILMKNDIENKIGITSKIIELELLLNAENNDYIENTISLLSDTE